MPLLIDLVAMTWEPRLARSRSSRPNSRERSAWEETRESRRFVMVLSRAWSAIRRARTSARDDASCMDGLEEELWFSLSEDLCVEWAGRSPFGILLADI